MDSINWDEPYATVAEVAEHLKVSKMTVYRMVHEGEFVSVRFGRNIRISTKSLGAYINGLEADSVRQRSGNVSAVS